MEVLEKIIPIIFIFGIGVLLRRVKLAAKENADFLLKLNFYITLPALVLLTLPRIKLETSLIYFPFIGVITVLLTYLASSLFAKKLMLPKTTLGVFLIGAMIINTGFTLPFLVAGFGDAGLVRKTIFDLGSDTLTYTLMYYLACKYGGGNQNINLILKKLVLSPILISFILGLLLNILHINFPSIIVNFLTPLGNMVSPIIMISLGIYFAPKTKDVKTIVIPLVIRMGLGLFIGIILTALLGLVGIDRAIAIVLCAAPVGYMTLTFSAMENLDKEFAANLVSYSILIGLLYTPMLIILFK